MQHRHAAVRTLACLVLGLLPAPATASQPEPRASDNAITVRVAVRESPPFLIKNDDGTWGGLAGDLWRAVEADLGADRALTTTFIEHETLADQLDAVVRADADLALGGITVTAERERDMDFTHPMHSDGLAIAVPESGRPAWVGALLGLISVEFFAAVGALGALLLVVGLIVWLLERRANPEQFGGETARGIASGFWWSAVTMTTVGYGDKAPATFLGRSVALVWMFASIILISSMTAAIASALTVSSLDGRVQSAADLPGARVGTIAGSASEDYLRRVGARPVYADTPAELVERLGDADGDALDAVLYDGPILRHLIAENATPALVLPGTVEPARYAWPLTQGSEAREAINRAILEATATPEWRDTLRVYLGAE